jgi:hypothetical protein
MSAELAVDILQTPTGTGKIKMTHMPPGFVISSAIIQNSTRTAMSYSAETLAFSGTFVKTRDDTAIIATCTVFGSQYNSGNCGVGLKFGSYWDFGVAYSYDGSWSSTAQTTIVVGQSYWNQQMSAGSYTVGFGWKTYNGGASERPFNYLNPNSADSDGRNQQFVSSIFVYEVIPSVSSVS